METSAAAKQAAIGDASRDLDTRDFDTAVRIIIHLTNL
jgi:hypothetical protein